MKWALYHLCRVPLWNDSISKSCVAAPKSRTPELSLPPRILLLDGGVSTHLESKLLLEQSQQQRHLKNNENIDSAPVLFSHRSLWSSSLLLTPQGQDAILSCHDDFFCAGSDIVSTVTYQCHYGACNFDQCEIDQMLRDGVHLARKAAAKSIKTNEHSAPSSKYVAASIGCYGASLADGSEYDGKYRQINPNTSQLESLIQFHRRKTEILMEVFPDGIAYETIPCLIECVAIVTLWKRLLGIIEDNPTNMKLNEIKNTTAVPAPHMKHRPMVWISFACCDGEHLNDGTKLANVMKELDELDPSLEIVQGVGINCCSFANGEYFCIEECTLSQKTYFFNFEHISFLPIKTKIISAFDFFKSSLFWVSLPTTWLPPAFIAQ